MSLPRVAIVGRTNVGKSRLFNRLTESRRALVTPTPGTTRDSNEARIRWRTRQFALIDTGGWTIDESRLIDTLVREQTETTIRTVDLVLFVVDGRAELTAEDRAFARWLRRTRTSTLLVVNKIENERAARNVPADVYQLGFGAPTLVSAMNGRATGDLLDVIVQHLHGRKKESMPPADGLRLAFVGRPNVGKSSLVNSLLNRNRVLVSPEPFTTRDAIEIPFTWNNANFILVDTAGLRRRARVPARSIEREGAELTETAIKLADVLIFVLDVSVPLTAQDRTIVSRIEEEGKCIVVAANKWDLIEGKRPETIESYRQSLASRITFIRWAPIIFISALRGLRVTDLLDAAHLAAGNAERVVSQPGLDTLLATLVHRHPPTRGKGTRYPKIRTLTQIGSKPPHFQLTIGAKEDLNSSYLPFVERMLREQYDFRGCPLRLSIRKLRQRN